MSKVHKPPVTGMKAYVKFHPRDLGLSIPRQYLTDPEKFVPKKDAELDEFVGWGIDMEDTFAGNPQFENSGLHPMQQRMMTIQGMYYGEGENARPEAQFVEALIKRKERTIAARDPASRADRIQRDYILHLHMPLIVDKKGTNFIWRKIKVSGGMPLEVLVDKILQPAMGWERNLHTWIITDSSDGAQFGTQVSSHMDRMHMGMRGFASLDATKFALADVLLEEGDQMSWEYDLGDLWWHRIKLEKMVSREESNGRVEILEGSGACPPENCRGNLQWNEKLNEPRTHHFTTKSHLNPTTPPVDPSSD